MNNKKAILMKSTLGIIIAVICILFLIGVGVSYAGIFTQKSELDKARASLSDLMGALNQLEKGENSEFFLQSPEDWLLTAWPNKKIGRDINNDEFPEQCKDKNWKNCICLCYYKKGGNYDCKDLHICDSTDEKDIYLEAVGQKVGVSGGGFQPATHFIWIEKPINLKVSLNSEGDLITIKTEEK